MTSPSVVFASNTRAALDRTILLMRDELLASASDESLLQSLRGTTVHVASNRANLLSEAAQHALVSTVLLAARSGASISLDVPNVELIGMHMPLTGGRLVDDLMAVGQDLIPGISITVDAPSHTDITLLIGDTPCTARSNLGWRLVGTPWTGALVATTIGGHRWGCDSSPFGPLAAAGLGATEIFKTTMRRLATHARSPRIFEALFAPVTEVRVAIAEDGTPPPRASLGAFDIVSAGAITHALLYALSRIPGVRGNVRIIEPERSDWSNLNRYSFLLRSRLGDFKALDLATMLSVTGIVTEPILARFDEGLLRTVSPLATRVLVGVDDIPTRWEVQRARPSWLGIGASSHYCALCSFHTPSTACAHCLHPVDEVLDGPIPTAAFVSHWAGLRLAALFVQQTMGIDVGRSVQATYMSTLRLDSPTGIWRAPVAARPTCPLACGMEA